MKIRTILKINSIRELLEVLLYLFIVLLTVIGFALIIYFVYNHHHLMAKISFVINFILLLYLAVRMKKYNKAITNIIEKYLKNEQKSIKK